MFSNIFPSWPSLNLILLPALGASACAPSWWRHPPGVVDDDSSGGGQDLVVIELPFRTGYGSRCTQGVGGSYSHHFSSTYHDVDLDTPNNVDDYVYAPVSGMAYVHDDDPTDNFGIHLNIDLADGTYIVIGHLADVFIEDGEEVTAGQLVAFEGSTGDSSGDHVHIGRHKGSASQDAILGESIEGLAFTTRDLSTDKFGQIMTSEMICGLDGGHTYESQLAAPLWHPNGSLIKTPESSTVYLLEEVATRAFLTEGAFWDRHYDFGDVALVAEEELDCYGIAQMIKGPYAIGAIYDEGTVWLLLEELNDAYRSRQEVRPSGWQAVLKSWGIIASTHDDLRTADELGVNLAQYTLFTEPAVFREGSLLRESTNYTVYVVSDGIAMPIESWETLLLMGFGNRDVIWVDDGVVATVQQKVGSCSVNAYCVSARDVTSCGGPQDEEGVFPETDEEEEQDNDTAEEETENTLWIGWTMPAFESADRITISGEYTLASGYSYGWQDLAETSGDTGVRYERSGVSPGDSLRFSVEFERDGTVSWSCLAPFPPGTLQGSVEAGVGVTSLNTIPTADPMSDGCGLTVIVP